MFIRMLQPIVCIDTNTHSDRKQKNYVKFIQKNYFMKPFNFLLIFFIGFITLLFHLLRLHVTSCVYNM